MDSLALHSWTLIILSACALGTPVSYLTLLRNYEESHLTQKAERLSIGGMRQTLKFSFFNSIIGFGAGLIIPLVATWLLFKFQVPDTYSGPYLALSGLTIAFSAVASPRLSKKLGSSLRYWQPPGARQHSCSAWRSSRTSTWRGPCTW